MRPILLARLVLGAVAALVLIFVAVTVFFIIYGMSLGVEPGGEPDRAALRAFSEGGGRWIALVMSALVVFLVGRWVALPAEGREPLFGLLLGALVSVVQLVMAIEGGSVSLPGVLTVPANLLAGHLGGALAAAQERAVRR